MEKIIILLLVLSNASFILLSCLFYKLYKVERSLNDEIVERINDLCKEK